MKRLCIFTLFWVLCLTSQVFAIDINYRGELNTGINYFTEQDGFEGIRQWGTVSMQLGNSVGTFFNDSLLYISLDYLYNTQIDQTDINLQELYVKYRTEAIDLQIGKQVVSWAINKGHSPNDIVNPVCVTGMALQEALENRQGVTAISSIYYNSDYNFSVEGIFVPKFIPAQFERSGVWKQIELENLENNLRSVGFDLGTETASVWNLKSSEIGIRLNTNVFDTDLGIVFYRGYNDTPILKQSIDEDHLDLNWVYYMQNHFGLQLAKVLTTSMMISAEAAYIPEKYYTDTKQFGNVLSDALYKSGEIQTAIEAEYSNNNLYANLGYFKNLLTKEAPELIGVEATGGLMGQVSYTFAEYDCEPGIQGIYLLDGKQVMLHPYINYRPRDGWELEVGYTLLDAKESKGLLGQYQKNDYFYTKVKFYF